MHQRLVGNEGGLLGYWDFNEPSGTTVHNRVSGGTNLSLTSTWSRVDVKRVTSLAGGNTVVTFPRTYLPGAGGWLLPTNLSQMQVLVVGAGGGGGADNGGGGGGGEMRASANQSITPSTRVTVRVGQGGRAGSWARPYGSTAGEASSVVGAGMDYLAQGGLGGAGFGSLSTAGGSGGRGGTGSNGAQGGQADSYCRPNPVLRSATAGSDGPSSAIGSATSRAFGGGGGGGTGYETFNTGSSAWGLAGGQGGGGRGNNYKLNHDGSARDGASAGQEGTPNTGGGGGGGSACNAHTSDGNFNGVTQRTDGGMGGSGVVIFSYAPGIDQAWNKQVDVADSYAFRNSTSDPVIPVANNAAWTFEAWLNPGALSSTWEPLFAQQSDDSLLTSRNSIWMNNSIIVLITPGADQNTGIPLPTNRWVHLAWTVPTSGNSVLYLDGNPVWTGALTRTSNAGTHFAVGGSRQPDHSEFNGHIDQVKIWGSALTGAQVLASMHSYSTWGGSPAASCNTGLRAHYDFNEFIDASVVIDRSGCGRNLAYNTAVAGSFASTDITSSAIVESGTAHTNQTFVKFNRTYLTAAGGWTPPSGISRFKALAVAGGGGGGGGINNAHGGGGGGAGGVSLSDIVLPSNPLPIQVGMGGAGGPIGLASGSKASMGQGSVIGSQMATTGGGAGGAYYVDAPTTGGSGGGAGASNALTTGANGTAGQGSKGGDSNGTHAGGGGGAIAAGGNATASLPGAGGNGLGSAITGALVQYGGGGGGGSGNTATRANGGLGGGGTGGNTGVNPTAGATNTGGGGGGGQTNTAGAPGGSGVVILSYGATLDVTRSPIVARVGSAFSQSIRVQQTNLDGSLNTGTFQIAVSASSGLTINGVALTQSYTVTSVNGIADFAGLGFASSVTGPVTLNFSSDAFVGTSLVVTPTFVANNLVINSSNATTGRMFDGEFYASSSAGVSFLNTADLHAHASLSNIVISVSGSISISADVSITRSSRTLVLRAGGDVHLQAFTLLTNGGALTLWSDADGNNSGAILTAANSQIRSQGGQILLTGGLNSSTGYAVGTALTQGSGVRIEGEVLSEGGDIVIRGDSGPNFIAASTPGWTSGVLIGPTNVNSAQGRISISARVNSSGDISTNHWGLGLGFGTSTPARLISTTGDISLRVDAAPASTNLRHGLAVWPGEISSTTGNISVSVISSTGANSVDWRVYASSTISTRANVLLESRAGSPADLGNLTISSSNQITVRANQLSIGTGAVITGSAAVALESFGASFSATVATTNLSLGTRVSSMRVGKSTNTSDITLGSSMTINGPLEVYGLDIDVTNKPSLIVTSQSARVLLRATAAIDLAAGTGVGDRALIQTNDGDIVLWADSDGSGTGYLYVGNFSVLNSANGAESKTRSGGGRITLGGGLSLVLGELWSALATQLHLVPHERLS